MEIKIQRLRYEQWDFRAIGGRDEREARGPMRSRARV